MTEQTEPSAQTPSADPANAVTGAGVDAIDPTQAAGAQDPIATAVALAITNELAGIEQRVAALEQAKAAAVSAAPSSPPAPPQPSMCRSVIYRDPHGVDQAATITRVRPTGVGLYVFPEDTAGGPVRGVPMIDPASEQVDGWFWPPRS